MQGSRLWSSWTFVLGLGVAATGCVIPLGDDTTTPDAAIVAAQNAAGAPTWTMTCTRIVATSSYGAYTVNWTDTGFQSSSTIPATICPVALPTSS